MIIPIHRTSAPFVLAGSVVGRSDEGLKMSGKLDPVLVEMIESRDRSEMEDVVEIIVALREPATEESINRLNQCGFKERSVIGDILTGTISVKGLAKLSDSADIVKIDASRPMFPETTE